MVRLFRRLFSKAKPVDPSAIIQEYWRAELTGEKQGRFVVNNDAVFDACYAESQFQIILKKRNVFAWVENPRYRYQDFFLDAKLSSNEKNGHSAAGFLIRMADERNYYYFLVSPSGHFRFDVVFNGSPRPIIDWTPCTTDFGSISLRILARGSYFAFTIGGKWIGEIEDDTIDAGGLGFAAQNFDERDAAMFSLVSLTVNSKPYDVEALFYRWKRYISVDPEQRAALARSLFAMGQVTAASVQLIKAQKQDPLPVADQLLLADCYAQTGMNDRALDTVNKALIVDPVNSEAIVKKSELLYLLNRLLELKEFLAPQVECLPNDARTWNLNGNAQYGLGNWSDALQSYQRAKEIDEVAPIYRINAARCLEQIGKGGEAFEEYLAAATLLFRDEDYDEVSAILSRLEAMDGGRSEVKALRAKVLFQDGELAAAGKLFMELVDQNSEDSSIYYMYGLILSSRNDRAEAEKYLRRATDLEPEFYLYWFRLAETLHLLGRDPAVAISRARELAPDDRWVLNLAGLLALEEKNPSQAETYLARAFHSAENDSQESDSDIIINYSEAMYQNGKQEEALSVLDAAGDRVELLNHQGNLYARGGRFEDAVSSYEKALRMSPSELDILLNCAAACVEADMVHRADEILSRVLEAEPTARAYTLTGHVAQKKGEYRRAESAYREALSLGPDNYDMVLNLVDLQVIRGMYEEARSIFTDHIEPTAGPRAKRVWDTIRDATELKLTCGKCGQEWWAPKEAKAQDRLRIQGELPDESPAGKCPECGEVYCIACAKQTLRDGRFHCDCCDVPLRLTGDHLKIVVKRYVDL